MVEHTRSLDFKVAFALGLGTMIAAGIFSLSGKAVASVGSSAVIAFAIAALIAGVTAASYSEFASIYSENGGGYLFSSRTFDNELLLYGVGASLFMGYCATTAFYLGTMDHWMSEFVMAPLFSLVGMEEVHLPGLWGVVAAILLGYLNSRGTEESGTFQVVVTGTKVAILFAFIGGAFAFAGPAQATAKFAAKFSFDAVGILKVSALAFITFFGFSAIAASAGEIIKPRETVPKAIAAGIVTVTVLYTFVIIAMVNAPVSNQVLSQGETAMGTVAAKFLGGPGQALIVAGAIFSMVSASNASILAASSIGDLMSQQGQAPRKFSRIHPEYNTPFWSVATVTGVICLLVVVFVTLFPAEGGVGPLHLGLERLTGFANVNLLAPLAVVNVALVVSRRRFPDIDRPFKVPAVPLLPAIGVLANVALVASLPPVGVGIGVGIEVLLVAAYLVWGGAETEETLVSEATSPTTVAADGSFSEVPDAEPNPVEKGRYTVLVPIARPHRAAPYARLATEIGRRYEENPVVKFLNVTQIPEQADASSLTDVAEARSDRISEELADVDRDGAAFVVEGHICIDIAFDILNTARNDGVDRILMGYPSEHPDVAEEVEYESPCDVTFADGVDDFDAIHGITLGTGGGQHHQALVSLASKFAADVPIHVVDVAPTGSSGTPEDHSETLAAFGDGNAELHETATDDIATALIEVAEATDSILVVGASRNRFLKRWVFGSIADRVVERARERNVPVIVYASSTGLSSRIESALFTPYRFLLKARA